MTFDLGRKNEEFLNKKLIEASHLLYFRDKDSKLYRIGKSDYMLQVHKELNHINKDTFSLFFEEKFDFCVCNYNKNWKNRKLKQYYIGKMEGLFHVFNGHLDQKLNKLFLTWEDSYI